MPNKAVVLYFSMVLAICALLMNSCGHDPSSQTAPSVTSSSSGENQSNIVAGDSQMAEDREREARMRTEGTIAFDPSQHADMMDTGLGHGQNVFISTFVDDREDAPDKHLGTLYSLLHHAPYVKLYSTEPVDISMSNVIASLLSANGFSIKQVRDSQESLIIDGTINKLWVGLHHSIYGEVDIDVKIVDPRKSDVVWSGKIAKTKEIEPIKGGGYAAFYGVMGDGTELEPFLNELISEAIVEAWNNGGMKAGFSKLVAKQRDKKALEQLAAAEPSGDDAQGNLKVGIAYYELRSFDNASKYFEKASQLDPSSARVHYLLGSSYIKGGKKDLAIDQYEVLKKLDENYAKRLFDEIYKD